MHHPLLTMIVVSYNNLLPTVVPAQLDVRIAIFGSALLYIFLEPQVAYLASNCAGYTTCLHLFGFTNHTHTICSATPVVSATALVPMSSSQLIAGCSNFDRKTPSRGRECAHLIVSSFAVFALTSVSPGIYSLCVGYNIPAAYSQAGQLQVVGSFVFPSCH